MERRGGNLAGEMELPAEINSHSWSEEKSLGISFSLALPFPQPSLQNGCGVLLLVNIEPAFSGPGHGTICSAHGKARSCSLTRCAGGLHWEHCRASSILHSWTTGGHSEGCVIGWSDEEAESWLWDLPQVWPTDFPVDNPVPGCPASLSTLRQNDDLEALFPDPYHIWYHHLLSLFLIGLRPQTWPILILHFLPGSYWRVLGATAYQPLGRHQLGLSTYGQ